MVSFSRLSSVYCVMIFLHGWAFNSYSQGEITGYLGFEISDVEGQVYNYEISENKKLSKSITIGAELNHKPEKNLFGISMGLFYSKLFYNSQDFFYLEELDIYYPNNSPVSLELHRFRFNSDIYLPLRKWNVFTGASVDYSVDDEIENPFRPIDVTDNRLQLSLRLGVDYSINKFRIKATYYHGFTKFLSRSLLLDDTYQLMIGYTILDNRKK